MKYYSLTEEEKTRLCRMENRLHANAYELADKVAEVVRKYDGKVFTKRLGTALNQLDSHIYVEAPYNSFNIKYVANSYEERSIRASNGDTAYIDNNEVYIVGLCKVSQDDHRALTDDNRIIADNIIKNIERMKKYHKETYNEVENQLAQVQFFKARKARITAEIEEHNDEVNYSVANYFDLTIKR